MWGSIQFKLILLVVGVLAKIGWYFYHDRLKNKAIAMEYESNDIKAHLAINKDLARKWEVLAGKERDEYAVKMAMDRASRISRLGDGL